MTDGADINGSGIIFEDVLRNPFPDACVFETKLNGTNAGICGAFKELWTKVPKIEKILYKEDPPAPQPNWFSELLNFTIDPNIAVDYKALQDKYHPTREYALHPALSSIFYHPDSDYGSNRGSVRKGLRDPYYRPILDLDITVPPFVNLYNHYKAVQRRLNEESLAPTPEIRADILKTERPVEKLRINKKVPGIPTL